MSQQSHSMPDYFLLTGLLSFLFFIGLGERPLSSPSEARYAEIPREMVENQDYITPRLNGLKYFEKPPFVYWIEAAPLKLGFTSEFALRFPIALFGILGCLLCYAFGNRIYSRKTGVASAVVLGTSILYYALTRVILLDLVFSVFVAATLFSFMIGVKCTPGKERFIHLILSACFIALAVLTKGLAGIVLPAGTIGLWLFFTGKWRALKPLYLIPCLLIFAVIVLPWHIFVAQKNPEFFNFYFIHEHFTRYLTTVHRRFQPFWFFVPTFLIGFLPWSLFLPKAFKSFIPRNIKSWKIYDVEAFLSLWIGFVFIFFSISSSKLVPYILPVFFPCAVIVGRHIVNVIDNQKSTKVEAWIYLMMACGLAYGVPSFLMLRGDTQLLSDLSCYIKLLKPILVVGSLGFLFLSYSRFSKWRFLPLVLSHIGLLVILNNAGTYLQKASMKPLVEHILTNHARAQTVVYGFYPQDLPYYLKRTVQVASWHGELDFGQSIEPHKKIYISDAALQTEWYKGNPLCVISKKDRLGVLSKLLGTPKARYMHDTYTLQCNHPIILER